MKKESHFNNSDLPIIEGKVYHLGLKPEELANHILIVNSRFKGKIYPYASRAHQDVTRALEREANKFEVNFKRGVTVTNSGFFANQGRTLSRIPLTVSEIDSVLSVVDTGIEGLRIENMEMEASFLLYFMGALGYRAGVISVVIDNRREDRFIAQYERHISDASKAALRALATLQ